jgi:predicted GNAT family N-acyltransferase
MKSFTLKRISIHDPEYPRVLALREAVLRKPLGLSLRDEDLSGEGDEHIVIALQDDIVTGCVMLKPVSGEALKLRQMAVAEAHQGKGVGAALIRDAEMLAIEIGFTTITLHARSTAVPFYERNGYRGSGEVFTEVGIPHLLMQKQLL